VFFVERLSSSYQAVQFCTKTIGKPIIWELESVYSREVYYIIMSLLGGSTIGGFTVGSDIIMSFKIKTISNACGQW